MATRVELTREAQDRQPGSFPGDPCPNPRCVDKHGRRRRLGVVSVNHKIPGFTTRFIKCKHCGWVPEDNKLVLKDPAVPVDLPGQMYLFEDPEEDAEDDTDEVPGQATDNQTQKGEGL